MKRKFTLLIAALALLTMIVQPGRAWGQAAVGTTMWAEDFSGYSANDVPSGTITDSHTGTTVYGDVTLTYACGGSGTKIYVDTQMGGSSQPNLLIAKSNGSFSVSGISTGGASELTVTYAKTGGGTLAISSTTTGVSLSGSDSGTTITTNGASTIDLVFTNTNGSKNLRFDDVEITVKTAGGGGGSDPEIHFNGQSANIGTNHPVGTPVSTKFTVYQSNLTDDITFQIAGYGSLNPSSVAQGADPTEVTWSYTPAVAGEFNTTITATSGTATASYTIYGEAKAIHNVNISTMTNGSVTANPTSGIQGTNIDLTITPADGYALETLSVVDGDNNELTVTNNRFQMPDSDVTVSATFEESSAVSVVDYLDREFTGVADGATTYSTWKDKTGTSGAVYSGNSAGSNNSIQLRTNGSASGIVSTASAGKVTKVEVEWNDNTSAGRKINIYGSNTAYTAASVLHNPNTAGTLIGTIDYGSTTELTITDDYEYIGIRSTSGALYLNWVKISWSSEEVPAPSFTITNNNELAYDATQGSFNFTVNNPATDGVTTVSEEVEWISDVAISDNSVTFNTTANTGAQRPGIITLTYTYNTTETVTKEVTITQAAAPVVYSTIPELFAAATTTETSVEVTFNDWVVSGVSTNGKNVFVTDNNGNGFVIYYSSDMSNTFAAGQILSGTAVSCTLKKYNGFAELLNVTATDLTITDGGVVTVADVAMANLAGVNTGALLHYDNLTCSIENSKYYLSDGTTTIQVYNALYGFDALENGKKYNITGVYQQYNSTKEILPRSADDIEEATVIGPTIIVLDDNVDIPAEGGEGTLEVSYEQFTEIVADVYFCDAQGEEAAYDWITAAINDDNNVDYLVEPNEGEARTAYFKVYALDGEEVVYSNLVTVTQAEYVNPYAALPFAFDGGRADIEGTNGLSQENLGTDYSSSPKLKFEKGNKDDDGLYSTLVLQFNERPGTLTFDIKGNTFSGGTFTVQTSENGETFTDLKNYTDANFGNTLYHEEFTNLGENVRYIKWIYTEKVNGNVALGNINLAKYVEPVLIPSITVDPAAVSADAEEHDGTLDLTYENLTITSMDDFDIQYYDAQGEETTEPDWVEVLIAEQDPTIGEGYVVSYYMIENEGDARTTYFKVYALNGEEVVYSNLVTINQAAPETPVVTDNYELYSGALVEGDYLIVYEDYAMNNVVDSDRLQYAEVEITEGVISTDNAAIVWHIAQSGEYWTIYSADADAYAASTGAKNKAQMLADGTDDMAMWTVSGTETYNFVNKANTEAGVNAYLRNNGTYGFACYAAGTGGPLSLYKKQDNTPSINLSSYSIEAPATATIEVLTITPANIENFDINNLSADYCNPDGSAIEGTKPDFVEFDFSEDEGYKLTCTISDNDGDARTAYFKVIYELGENDYVYSNVVTVNQEAYVAPVATITVNPDFVEATKDETYGTLSITLENIEITEAGGGEFSVYFCDAYGEILPDQSSKPDWIEFDFLNENDTWSLYYLIGENETFEPRTAYIKVYGLGDDATTDAYSNLITFTQATAVQTYTLVESDEDLEAGVHYIIAGKNNLGAWYAMGKHNGNNRKAIAVVVTDNTITETDEVHEFVISGDGDNFYTIYDEDTKSVGSNGYLYAAGASSNNYLKTYDSYDNKGQWTIEIDETTNVASITANMEGRNLMRFNNNSGIFSCYASNQDVIYLYKKDNDVPTHYYSPSVVTVTEDVDASVTPVVVLENEILTLTGSLTSSGPDDIVINDGGQLVFNGDDVKATVKKQTIGESKADHWYTIASPVANNKFGEVENLTSETYDLYRYNETTSTWENYKETAPEPHVGFYYGDANSAFEAGRGYLYYNAAGSELSFAGTLNNDGVTYDLTAGTTSLAGINLMGNPFTQAITLDDITLSDGALMSEGCYVLTNADGWGASIESINPCEGFLVRVDKNTTATISKPTSGSKSRANRDYIKFTVANSQYEDVTYAMFSKGLGLDKINHRNADIPMIYIPQDGKNYAIATMSDNTEMFNLNFKAMTTGKYTLSYKTQGIYSYLHVIDRFTGEDIDMLVEGEYSFIGSTYDNDARFIVKLSYNANIGEFDTNSIFAYQNGDEIIVNGEGQLQVYDVMGRFVQCINVNGTESISASQFSDAVYILRMVGETVKTQKIVVR